MRSSCSSATAPTRSRFGAARATRVRLVGKRADVADWLAAADVVAFPSRWEGMSIGMLEAMASGRSVVASDVGGAQEALGGESGAVVPPEDAAALAQAIDDRLLDPARHGRRGSCGPRACRAISRPAHDDRRARRALRGAAGGPS